MKRTRHVSAQSRSESARAYGSRGWPVLAVFDIDGVVADVRHRLHHLRSAANDGGAFFARRGRRSAAARGRPRWSPIWAQEHEVVWLTGRPEWLRNADARLVRPARASRRRTAHAPRARPPSGPAVQAGRAAAPGDRVGSRRSSTTTPEVIDALAPPASRPCWPTGSRVTRHCGRRRSDLGRT